MILYHKPFICKHFDPILTFSFFIWNFRWKFCPLYWL